MGKVSNGHLSLLLDVGKERSLIIDFEGEDAVLVGCCKRGAEDGTVRSCSDRVERKTMEWGEHGELELDGVGCSRSEGYVVSVGILRQLDVEALAFYVSSLFQRDTSRKGDIPRHS